MRPTESGWPERFPILTGHAWALGLDVTADLIVPPGHAADADLRAQLMTPIDPSFPQRIAAGDIIVGGDEFARGTRDDLPARALLAGGISAVVASSFDAAFARSAFSLGLLAVEVNEALVIHTGARLRVDLEGARVVNLSSGDRYPIRNASDEFVARFRARER
jgi:3-isopropylmalate/(R)-2-methylmalate dehydratase small subunit